MTVKGWTLDRSVNLGNVLTILTACVAVVLSYASLNTKVEILDSRVCSVEERVQAQADTRLKVERIEERLASVQEMLTEMRAEMRVQRERK